MFDKEKIDTDEQMLKLRLLNIQSISSQSISSKELIVNDMKIITQCCV